MKVQIESYGCSANMNDAEIMRGILEKDHDIDSEAEIVVINTCTVKGPTEKKILNSIRNHASKNKKIIITGCMAEAQSKMLLNLFPEANILGPDHIDKIDDVVISEQQTVTTGKRFMDKALLPQTPLNSVSGIIQISRGCDSACTYCITKAAKGHISSYPESSILDLATSMIASGKKEIWLTSQDNTAYGVDDGKIPRLSRLIKRMARIEGDFMIRNGMGNPHNLSLFIDDFIESYKNDKVFKFVHLPIQSGSNKVLKLMRRQYTREEFTMLVKKLREHIPELTIATDIIYGYPEEDESDFLETLDIMNELKFDIVNISRFWPRPGTYASKLKMLPKDVLEDRGKRITQLFRKISKEQNQKWLNWEGELVICERGKNNSLIGRNYCYKTMAITEKEIEEAEKNTGKLLTIGEKYRVKIYDYDTFHLKARILYKV